MITKWVLLSHHFHTCLCSSRLTTKANYRLVKNVDKTDPEPPLSKNVVKTHDEPPLSKNVVKTHDESSLDDLNINISKLINEIKSNVRIDLTSPKYELDWRERKVTLRELPGIYLSLMKFRLTTLVVLTSIAGFGFAPVHGTSGTFIALTCGVFLCCGAANTINQVMEQPFDAQMDRCKQRVLVQQKITPFHAAMFGMISGSLGIFVLYNVVNPLTGILGLSTILLYTVGYTMMKRFTIANTWVGSIVGAIPPAMGWAACTGTLDVGALSLCALLYFWQFPHFNSLSWNLRADYCRAGYHMMCVSDSALCARVSLRNTLALIPLCIVIPFTGISHCSFSFYSVILNTYFSYLAWKFYQNQDKETARELFQFSLWYLPIVFGFLTVGYMFKERTRVDDRHHMDGAYIKELCPVIPK